jgi:S1-C subfamily serine protease
MKKLLMALLLMFSSVSIAADLPTILIEAGTANIYKVSMESGASGTAFYVGDDRLVTACHVVISSPNVILINADAEHVLTATIESCNRINDIAILKLNDHPANSKAFSAPPLVISLDDPKHGQTVYGAGYPIIFRLTFVDGHWQDMYSSLPNGEFIAMTTAPAIFGDSGSPLLAIIDDELVVVGIRLGIFTWPIAGEPGESKATTDLGFVSGLSYVGISESIQNELDRLELIR